MSRGIIDRATLVGCDGKIGPVGNCPLLIILASDVDVDAQVARRGWVAVEGPDGVIDAHYCREHAQELEFEAGQTVTAVLDPVDESTQGWYAAAAAGYLAAQEPATETAFALYEEWGTATATQEPSA